MTALLVLALVLAPAAAAQQRVDLAAAVELERQGRHAEAAERFMRVLADDPDNVAALFGLERTLQVTGQLERALPLVAAAVAHQPRDGTFRSLELRMLTTLGRHAAAAAAATRWITAAPDAVEPYREGAYAAAQRGDLREARRILELGRDRLGETALIHELAQVEVVAGRWAEAALRWHRAAETDETLAAAAGLSLAQAPPDERQGVLRLLLQELGDPVARRIAADLLVGWDRPDEAWALLDANLPADPRLAVATLRRFAERARLAGTTVGARVRGFALERAAGLDRGPGAQRARIEAARAFAEAGDRAGAERMLDRIAEDPASAPPSAIEAMAALIRVTADAGRVDEAERRFASWRERFPEDTRGVLRERIAWAWIRRGELARATRALGDDSTVATVAIHGWLALFRGDLAEAAERFRVAGPYTGTRHDATRRTEVLALLQRIRAERAPTLGEALLTLERGDTADAVDRLARAARAFPPAGGGADLLAYAGRLAAKRGDPRGEALLREAVGADSLGPAAPIATLALAELAWRRGRSVDAIALLEHLILAYPASAVVPQARRLLDRVRGAVPNS